MGRARGPLAYSGGRRRRFAARRTTARWAPRTLVVVSSPDRILRAASLRLERLPPDVVIAATTAAIQLGVTLMAEHSQDEREPLDALAVGFLVAGPTALVWRRTRPVAVLAFTLIVTLAYWSLDYPRGPAFLALIVAFVSAINHGHRAAAWLAFVLGWAGTMWLPGLVGDADFPTFAKALAIGAEVLVLGAAVELVNVRKERMHEAQRARQQEELARSNQERLRIARELHDVLAHNVSLINVQAGTALHLLEREPERARPALEAIKDASSETLREVRSVLEILRRPEEQSPLAPTAGVAGLNDLIARTTAAGIPVESELRGHPRPLPASVDLAVYRIVQEALTNVARHARPARAVVRLTFDDEDVTLEVEDNGTGFSNGMVPAGNGIAGMRERVAALGGEFSAGPANGAGFRVAARLPLGGGP
jgi:signal transduction histidine kinase